MLTRSSFTPSASLLSTPLPPGLTVLQCKDQEAVDLFYTWAERVGWNPGQKAGIRDVLLKTDPGGYFYGKIDPSCVIIDSHTNHINQTELQQQQQQQKGQEDEVEKKKIGLVDDPSVISVISAICYGDEQAWIGCYITDPKYRGRGYGISTFNRALEHVGHSRTSVGLNAVFAQVDNYRKIGFTKQSWVNERRRGCIKDLVQVQERELADRLMRSNENIEGLILLSDEGALEKLDLEQLPRIEKKYTGFQRPQFTKDWVLFHAHHPEEHRVSVAYLSSTERDPLSGKPLILGYACVRPGVHSYRVGPLYTEDPEIARMLLVKMAIEVLSAHEKEPLEVPLIFDIDIPDQNKASVDMFDRIGWKNSLSSLRMWKGVVPPYDVSGCFGISTLENG
ncbi:hypothetical protein FBU30_009668 [Linnemannia zychae]|nr:hypothetical protein FBU30_009668 [Linnemannia zychae]